MTLKKRYYKKYFTGGDMSSILGLVGNTANSIDPGNEYGKQSTTTNLLKGASTGAQLGTMIAPGIGTAIGAGAGLIGGFFMDKKQKKQQQQMQFNEGLMKQQQELNRSAAVIGNNPALVTGNPGTEFYASGGFLKNRYYDKIKASGGEIKSMSSDSAEVQGPSHEQGGVDLPQYQSELEGGESIQDDYVFSDRLGFAKIHKKLAKAVGKIEQKPSTPDRLNALKNMNGRIGELKQLQEMIRQQNNLQ
jgi:hypothetical protein